MPSGDAMAKQSLSTYCSAMQSFEIHQARASHAEMCVTNGSACHTTSFLALSNHQLHKLRALPVFLMLAAFFVYLVDFIVAAPEAG